MSSRKKLIKNIVLFICCLAVAGGAVLYNYGYKMCWKCSTADYYERGKEFSCRDKAELQQTGLDFLRVAVEHKYPRAEILLAECYMPQLPAGYASLDSEAYKCLSKRLHKNPTAAKELFNRAYKAIAQEKGGDGKLLFNLAKLIEAGIITTDNPGATAHKLYVQAAKHKYFPAIRTLAYRYNDEGDYDNAKKWLHEAAEAGKDIKPALMLGDYYYYGKGEVQDYNKAIRWYREALEVQKKLLARASEEKREAGEDVPMARIDMATRQLQKERLQARVVLRYRVGGNANHYKVYTADHDKTPIGTVTRNSEGVVAKLDDSVKAAATLPTTSKTFTAMNEGMDWLLHAYARSKYGSYTKVILELGREETSAPATEKGQEEKTE